MGKSTISMAIFKFANCNSWPGRVSSLFHPFYPHLGRCFASEIRSRDLFDFRFQKVAESGDCLNFQRDFSTFLALGKVMPEGENHKSQWFFTSILHDSSKFFMYSHASRLYLLISWSSKKKCPFLMGRTHQHPANSAVSWASSNFRASEWEQVDP